MILKKSFIIVIIARSGQWDARCIRCMELLTDPESGENSGHSATIKQTTKALITLGVIARTIRRFSQFLGPFVVLLGILFEAIAPSRRIRTQYDGTTVL